MRRLTSVFLAVTMAFAVSARAQEPQKPAPPETPKPELKPLPDDPEPIAGDAIYATLATGSGPASLKVKAQDYVVVTFWTACGGVADALGGDCDGAPEL